MKWIDRLLIAGLLLNLAILFFLSTSDWRIYYYYKYNDAISLPLISPVDPANLTLPFEGTYGAFREPDRLHQGVDLFCELSTPIKNVHPGVLIKKGVDRLGGKSIWILGLDNRLYYYAHLNQYGDCQTGDHVKHGEIIGLAGNNGNALNTPVHLHFEIMIIERLFPFKKSNINPFPELQKLVQPSLFETVADNTHK